MSNQKVSLEGAATTREKALAFVKSVYALRHQDDGSLPFNALDYVGMEDLIRELSAGPPVTVDQPPSLHVEEDKWAQFKELIRIVNTRPCPNCTHSDVASDGLCAALVPLIDKEPHGSKRCRCPCVNFAPANSLPMPINEESVAWAEEADRLANALWDLVHVIEADDLIPETVSYMRQAREVLQHWPDRHETEEAKELIWNSIQAAKQ